MLDILKKRYRFRMIVPVFPTFNIYSKIACSTTIINTFERQLEFPDLQAAFCPEIILS